MIFHLNIFTVLILPSRTPHAIIDAGERVVSALAGQPNDPQWANVSDSAADDVREAGDACVFSDEQLEHRRGEFPALAVGVSFGGGQKVGRAYRLQQLRTD